MDVVLVLILIGGVLLLVDLAALALGSETRESFRNPRAEPIPFMR
jgi:hypothetical protein